MHKGNLHQLAMPHPPLCEIVPQVNEHLRMVNENNEDVDAQRQPASAC